MTGRRRIRVLAALAALTVLVSAPRGVRAQAAAQDQDNPSAAQLNGSASVVTYEEASSEKCTNGSPFAGMNPLVCHGEEAPVDSMGKCSIQGLLLWKKVGSTCLYCKPITPPVKGIIIPWDQGWVAEGQGFSCAANMSDDCTIVCIGPGTFKPPAGLMLVNEPPPEQPPNSQPPPPPNPAPGPITPQVIPPDNTLSNYCSQLKPPPGLPHLTDAQLAILQADVAAAKAMVAKAKAHTDKVPWDAGTQDLSKKYFGDASTNTQNTVRQYVNNVQGLLNQVTSISNVFYPDGADVFGSPTKESYVAYTHQAWGPIQIFLSDNFWNVPPTPQTDKPVSQPMVVIHELSHLPGGANTLDFAYGQTECEDLVWFNTDAVGKLAGAATQKLAPGWRAMPSTEPQFPLTQRPPIQNADSFMFFVNDVANQAIQK